jgi:hypothetical protein
MRGIAILLLRLMIKDVFSKEQKHQIISKLTDAMVSIEGENMRGVTWCVVEEVESRRQSLDHCRLARAGARESRLRARSGAGQYLVFQFHRLTSWIGSS